MTITDRYGLEVTTPSSTAVGHFQDGMDRLLSYSSGAEDSLPRGLGRLAPGFQAGEQILEAIARLTMPGTN